MNLRMVLVVLVAVLSTVLGKPQYFGKKRQFPGQRLRGATNYGTHSFGGKGFINKPMSRLKGKSLEFPESFQRQL